MAGRVRVVASPYPTRWINICLVVPVLIFVGYLLCGYPHNFLISMDTRGYLQKNKSKYLTIYFNCKFK